MRQGIFAFAIVALAMGPFSAAEAGTTVVLDGVTIDGSTIDSGAVAAFFGVPYASAARWSPPKAHAALSNPFDAANIAAAPVCPQENAVVVAGFTLPQSEDCLALSVFAPIAATATSNLPVMVWIHGGGLTYGTAFEYFPYKMVAAKNIVVVSINYRLGALGWLAQSAFAATKASTYENVGDAGNYGLMDQQYALAWVKKNIAAFGGDPHKVTIAGQSAGGLSVLLHLASTTTTAGLFRGAIVESGAFDLYALPTLAAIESEEGNPFVNGVLAATGTVGHTDCSKLTAASPAANIRTCLDGASLATILSVQNDVYGAYGVYPGTGTRIVPSGLAQALTAGNFFHVPVLQGGNSNEGRFFEPLASAFATIPLGDDIAAGGPADYDLANSNAACGGVCTYRQEIDLTLAALGVPAADNTAAFDKKLANADYKTSAYPNPYLSNAASADEGLAQIDTDYIFACSMLDADTDLAKYSTVYAYEFDDASAPPSTGSPALAQTPNNQYGYPTASEHGAELNFLFKWIYTGDLDADELTLQSAMWNYWGDFVTDLNPNKGATLAAWPAFGTKGTVTNKIERLIPPTPAAFTTFAKEHECTLWEPIVSAE